MAYKITWKPVPLYDANTDTGNYTKGRSSRNHVPIAIVNHRMVGWLNGTDAHFANATSVTSTHFGIGTRSSTGLVEVSQYVDLADTAFGNGNYDPSGGWPLIKKLSTGAIDNPNYYTVSIEHQDGATTGRGIVTPETKAASLWLQKILLTGDLNLYAQYGIRCSNPLVAQALARIVPGNETIIDHNRIAGNLKPTCWRAWLDDGGFLPWKPTLIASLLDTGMTLDEILALLNTEIKNLQTQVAQGKTDLTTANTTIQNLTTARDALQTKLTTAKAKTAVFANEIAAL
jgi:hypothetical protein